MKMENTKKYLKIHKHQTAQKLPRTKSDEHKFTKICEGFHSINSNKIEKMKKFLKFKFDKHKKDTQKLPRAKSDEYKFT